MPAESPDTTAAAAYSGAAPAGSAAPAPRRLGLALAVIATAQLMVALDLTIVTVALPHIQAALGFSGTNLGWSTPTPWRSARCCCSAADPATCSIAAGSS